MKYNLAIIIEKDADGYFAYAPDLQGCYTQGDTFEEVVRSIREVVELHIEDRIASGEEIPLQSQISITTIEVSIGAEATSIDR